MNTILYTHHLHAGAPGIFSDFIRSVQMLKREWGAKNNGKPPHLFNPWWNCSLGSWVCGGRPAFDRTAAKVPELALKDLPLGRTLMIHDNHKILAINTVILKFNKIQSQCPLNYTIPWIAHLLLLGFTTLFNILGHSIRTFSKDNFCRHLWSCCSWNSSR